jgi:serine/threonine protein kinase
MIGRTIWHYRITEKLGARGMGEGYRAYDQGLERDVATKFLPTGTIADESARKWFRKQALPLARLNHPNIATIYDFGAFQSETNRSKAVRPPGRRAKTKNTQRAVKEESRNGAAKS